MPDFVVMRHSVRAGAGAHLTAAGVQLARNTCGKLPRLEQAVTSDLPRATETATAMEVPIVASVEDLRPMGETQEMNMGWPGYISNIARSLTREPQLFAHADRVARWIRDTAGNSATLIVTHGGTAEMIAIALEWQKEGPLALPPDLGRTLSYCDSLIVREDAAMTVERA